MKDSIDNVIKFAQAELELMNLHEHEFGVAFIKFLQAADKLSCGDRVLMRTFLDMPKRVYNQFPLVPLQENEFVEDAAGIFRHPRYDFAFKDPSNGQYLDQHGVGFIKEDAPHTIVYCKNLDLNSTTNIDSFPYYPPAKIVEL